MAVKNVRLKALFRGFFLFIFAACGSGAGVQETDVREFTSELQGQTIAVELAEEFLIRIPNPGSGGYLLLEEPQYEAGILSIIDLTKIPAEKGDRDGNFGQFEWRFKAESPGTSPLAVNAFRPWEGPESAIVVFEAVVIVKDDGNL